MVFLCYPVNIVPAILLTTSKNFSEQENCVFHSRRSLMSGATMKKGEPNGGKNYFTQIPTQLLRHATSLARVE